jgi:hypothetical protein
VPGEEQCTISDPRLTELSGLVATDDGYIAVNDENQFGNLPIILLDQSCQVVGEIFYPSPSRDPEDAALDRETNTLWVADIGDNSAAGTTEGESRATVALWKVELDGDRTPVIHRFAYPDGPRDAEALLLDGDGTPIIVTKQIGTAELYVPAGELQPGNPPENAVPLEKVGEFSPPETGTPHVTLPAVAGQVITGAASSPDGSRVVLRTYTDALEFDVTEGDVVAAVTTGEPRVTPLPEEPLGEAITYSPDGERFLTVSEVPQDAADFSPVILAYTPAQPAADPQPTGTPPAGSGNSGGSFEVQDIVNLIAAIGVIGLIMLGVGVFGIVRARRQAAALVGKGGDPDGGEELPATGRARLSHGAPWEANPAANPAANQGGGVYTSGAAHQAGAEYGGTQYGGADRAGTQYGSTRHGGTEYGGTEYGGTEYGGTEYGGTEYGAQPGGTEYGGTEYGGTEYGGTEYGGTEYGAQPGGTEYGGTEYGGTQYGGGGYREAGQGGAGYRERPYDQDWPHEHPENGHPGNQGHPDQAYPQAQANPQAQGGTYSGGTYQSGGDYSDDPDYPYEFRERGQW